MRLIFDHEQVDDDTQPADQPTPEQLAADHERYAWLVACMIGELTALERGVLYYTYWADLSHHEIAELFGWRWQRVQTQQHRALRKLRQRHVTRLLRD